LADKNQILSNENERLQQEINDLKRKLPQAVEDTSETIGLYAKYGATEKEGEVLSEVLKILGLHEFVIVPEEKTDMHDGAIAQIERKILVEVQHGNSDKVCLDVISKLYGHSDLRGKTIQAMNAYKKLEELAPEIENKGKWGKHLDPSFDADLIAIKLVPLNKVFVFSAKEIASRIKHFIDEYGVKFNSKHDASRNDSYESAFIKIPPNDSELVKCICDTPEAVIKDLEKDGNKYFRIKTSLPIKSPSKTDFSQSREGLIFTIVWILQQNGSRLPKAKVVELIEEYCSPECKKEYWQVVLWSGGTRWEKQIEGSRWKATTDHKLMKRQTDSGRGIWELTEKGKRWKP
jgi:hypothetical protein